MLCCTSVEKKEKKSQFHIPRGYLSTSYYAFQEDVHFFSTQSLILLIMFLKEARRDNPALD